MGGLAKEGKKKMGKKCVFKVQLLPMLPVLP